MAEFRLRHRIDNGPHLRAIHAGRRRHAAGAPRRPGREGQAPRRWRSVGYEGVSGPAAGLTAQHLARLGIGELALLPGQRAVDDGVLDALRRHDDTLGAADRKSTRLNSSHGYISYAVFCLKKKNTQKTNKA